MSKRYHSIKTDTVKTCSVCKNVLPLSEFSPHHHTKLGRSHCKKCSADRGRIWRSNNYERRRNYILQRNFGITLDQFNILYETQNGTCPICFINLIKKVNKGDKKDGHAVVDHCHKTNRVRGLLCDRCNKGIGIFSDHPDVLRNAAKYLEEKI